VATINKRRVTKRGAIVGAGIGVAGAGALGLSKVRHVACFLWPSSAQGYDSATMASDIQAIFTDAPFASCHASSLAATDTGLAACWFAGTREGDVDVGIWFARRGASGWSAPVLVAQGADDAGRPQPCWNPVLWRGPEGRLLLFYKVGPSPRAWWGVMMTSDDDGQHWSGSRRLPDGMLGPIKNKPVMLSDGRLLCPSSSEHDGWRVHFEWTADGGLTWEKSGAVGDGAAFSIIQPTVLVHPGGRLQALCRSRQGVIVETWSDDGGRHWSAPKRTDLPNPNSGFDGVTLADGRHLLVYNPVRRCRSPLCVAVSDDGAKWRGVIILEDGRGEFSYPAVIQAPDGRIHISYTNRRETISHVVLAPETV